MWASLLKHASFDFICHLLFCCCISELIAGLIMRKQVLHRYRAPTILSFHALLLLSRIITT